MVKPIGFRWDTLLLAAFVATLPLYSPSLAVFHDLLCAYEEFMQPAMYAMLVGMAVVGVAFVVASGMRHGDVLVKAPVVIAGAVCFVGGYLLLAFVFNVEAFGSNALAVAGGVLLAAGSVVLCVAWGVYMATYDMRQALFACALVVGLGALLRLAMTSAPTAFGIVMFAALGVVGVLTPCIKAVNGALDISEERVVAHDAEIERATAHAGRRATGAGALSAAAGARQGLMRMAQVAGLAFVGLLVFAFATGSHRITVFDDGTYIEMVSDLVAAVIVLPLVLVKSDRPLIPLVYQVILPLTTLVLIILGAFPDGSAPREAALLGTYVLLGAVAIVAMASLTAMAHAREFSPALIYSATIACFAAVAAVGIALGATELFDDDNGGPVLLVICTCYYAFVLAVCVLQAWFGREREDKRSTRATTTVPAELTDRCEQVAKQGGLTPRETEVLCCLGRGHGITYVANSLVISENTVRTHVRNIYHKLGVSSREELLKLIDEQ